MTHRRRKTNATSKKSSDQVVISNTKDNLQKAN